MTHNEITKGMVVTYKGKRYVVSYRDRAGYYGLTRLDAPIKIVEAYRGELTKAEDQTVVWSGWWADRRKARHEAATEWAEVDIKDPFELLLG